MDNMWKLSLSAIDELLEDSDYGASWEPVSCKGNSPGSISYHKSAVFGQSVVIFGGRKDFHNNPHAYEFDFHHQKWSKLN